MSSARTLCISINRPALCGKHNLFILYSHCLKWVIMSALLCLRDAILKCNSFHSVVYINIPEHKRFHDKLIPKKKFPTSILLVVSSAFAPFVQPLRRCFLWQLSAEKVTEMLMPKYNFKSARHISEQTRRKGKCWVCPSRNISTLGRANDTPVSQLVRLAQSTVMASIKDQNVKPALGHGSI